MSRGFGKLQRHIMDVLEKSEHGKCWACECGDDYKPDWKEYDRLCAIFEPLQLSDPLRGDIGKKLDAIRKPIPTSPAIRRAVHSLEKRGLLVSRLEPWSNLLFCTSGNTTCLALYLPSVELRDEPNWDTENVADKVREAFRAHAGDDWEDYRWVTGLVAVAILDKGYQSRQFINPRGFMAIRRAVDRLELLGEIQTRRSGGYKSRIIRIKAIGIHKCIDVIHGVSQCNT